MIRQLFLSALALGIFQTAFSQQLLNIDFGNAAVLPVAVGPAAIGSAGDIWNFHSHPFESIASTPNLVWSDGSPSGAGIVVTNASGTWVSGSTNGMMAIHLYNFGGPAFLTITNLSEGTYDVLAYGRGGPEDDFNTPFLVHFGTNRLGPISTGTASGWRTAPWTEGVQYVRFRNVSIRNGNSLTIEGRPSVRGTPSINGLQILRKSGLALALSPSSPFFTNSLNVSIEGGVGSDVRFTLDGTEPGPASQLYAGPIRITSATLVRARGFSGGIAFGSEVAASYQRIYAVDDGISVTWRIRHFGAGYLTDPRVAAEADPDGDGASNLQEFVGGTDPLDPLSGQVLQIRPAISLSWNAVPGRRYRLIHKDRLSTPNWTTIRETTASQSTLKVIIEAPEPLDGFYAISAVQ